MKKGGKIFIFLGLILLLVLALSFFKEDKTPELNVEEINTIQNEETADNAPKEQGINFGVDLEVVESLLVESEWEWVETLYNDGTALSPKDPGTFSLVFSENGKFSGRTDCNDIMGTYKLKEGEIAFEKIASTKKACGGVTQEGRFIKMLEDTQGFIFTADGALALTLKFDSGSVIFEPVR